MIFVMIFVMIFFPIELRPRTIIQRKGPNIKVFLNMSDRVIRD